MACAAALLAFALCAVGAPRAAEARPRETSATQFFANGVDVFGRPPRCRGCHEIVGNMERELLPRIDEFKAVRARKDERRATGAVTSTKYGELEDIVEEGVAGACRYAETYHVPQARKACEKLLEAFEEEIIGAYVAHGKRPIDAPFDANWEVCREVSGGVRPASTPQTARMLRRRQRTDPLPAQRTKHSLPARAAARHGSTRQLALTHERVGTAQATRACTQEYASRPLSEFRDDDTGESATPYMSETQPKWSDGDGVLLGDRRRAVRKTVAGTFANDVEGSADAQAADVLAYFSFPSTHADFHQVRSRSVARAAARAAGLATLTAPGWRSRVVCDACVRASWRAGRGRGGGAGMDVRQERRVPGRCG